MSKLGECCGTCELRETEPAPGIVCTQCGWGHFVIPKEAYVREEALLNVALHTDECHPGTELVYKEVP